MRRIRPRTSEQSRSIYIRYDTVVTLSRNLARTSYLHCYKFRGWSQKKNTTYRRSYYCRWRMRFGSSERRRLTCCSRSFSGKAHNGRSTYRPALSMDGPLDPYQWHNKAYSRAQRDQAPLKLQAAAAPAAAVHATLFYRKTSSCEVQI